VHVVPVTVGDELDDAVVGGIAPAPVGVTHRHTPVLSLGEIGERPAVEDECDVLARACRCALKPAKQPSHRPVAVVPPAVGARPDDVHAVDHDPRPVAHASIMSCLQRLDRIRLTW
jgi:hypothetical protein